MALTMASMPRLRILGRGVASISTRGRRSGSMSWTAARAGGGSVATAFKALLATAGGLFMRNRPVSHRPISSQELPSVVAELRKQSFILNVSQLKPSPLIVDADGEMHTGHESAWESYDLQLLISGDAKHPFFFLPLRVRLRFGTSNQLPDVRLGGQLAFPLVSRDRRPPKAFWDRFKASVDSNRSDPGVTVELLKSLRLFLLDPTEYLGLKTSEGSPEAKRLATWCRDVARLNGQRLEVIQKYAMQVRHPELFDPVLPLKKEWFHEKIWSFLKGGTEDWQDVLTEHVPGEVYSFAFFTDAFCDTLLEEIFNFYDTGLPARRPNSMNNYGIILSDIGLEPFIDKVQELLQPLGEGFFPGPGSCWDGHHCFIVRYREGEDLGLDMHTDDSDVTFNICLGLDFAGAGLQFCGSMGAPDHRKHSFTYGHKKGHCIVHLGRKRHGADDITSGERLNLILWNHSSEFRSSAEYQRPAYLPEESAPDLVCLSYTHDRDFGTFKDYPKGKELFRGRGWCPPSQAEYPDFKPETAGGSWKSSL
eukprot:s1688_g10.t1